MLFRSDSIRTIVDRFSGYVKIIPVYKSTTSAHLIEKFLYQVYSERELPEDIVSDRDARFTSKEWTTFYQHHGINQSMSTTYHPRTDGRSEIANKVIIQKIKHAMFDKDTNWLEQVPFLQAKLNRTFNSSRNATPYEIVYGHNPRLKGELGTQVQVPEALQAKTERLES